MQTFNGTFSYKYIRLEFPGKKFKICFKVLYSDQAFEFEKKMVTLFPQSVKKRLINKSFEILGMEKEYEKNNL